MAVYIPQIGRRPHLFLSHSSDNGDFALTLADDLTVLEVDVWIDKWEIEGGDSLIDKINDGLSKSHYVALLFSKSFINKQWSSAEVKAALNREISGGEKVIIPLVLEQVEIPPLLSDKLYISLDNYYEAIARIAAIVHGISPAEISRAINRKRPLSLDQAVDTLAYAGRDPYMIIPEDVFNELADSGYATVEGNRLSFPVNSFLDFDGVSERSQEYLKRVRVGINRDRRRLVQ